MSWRASGLRAWLLQRVSAVYMAIFLVYFLGVISICPPKSYAGWQGWMTSTTMSLATALFFLLLLAHAWVGMRDVLMDYVKPYVLRLTLLILLAMGLIIMALWVLQILLMGGA
jgi:succinate dehydrogenase / fumarate reductase membrane anchor subunit